MLTSPPPSMNLPGKPTAAAFLPKSKTPVWTCKRSGWWSQCVPKRETMLRMNRLPLPLSVRFPRLRELSCRFMGPAQGRSDSLLSMRSPLLLVLLAILVLWEPARQHRRPVGRMQILARRPWPDQPSGATAPGPSQPPASTFAVTINCILPGCQLAVTV